MSSAGEKTHSEMDSFGLLPELSFLDPFSSNVEPLIVNKPEVVKVKKTTHFLLPDLDEETPAPKSEPIYT